MADIRINDLPLESSPPNSEFLAIDGVNTRKATIQNVVNAGAPIATQLEAQTGTNAVKRMTPLTTKQSIASEVGVTVASAAQGTTADNAAQKSANLSDLADASTARGNLGLGDSATLNVGTTSGTVAAGDDTRVVGAAQKSANLSDLASASTARTNLGLGDSATLDVGTASGTVAAGDDVRIVGAAFTLPTFSGASSATIPSSITRVYVEDRGARFRYVASEPAHPLKFQNGSRWFEIDETVLTSKMCGAGTGDVTGATDTAAFAAAAAYFGEMASSSYQTSNGGDFYLTAGVYYINDTTLFEDAGVRIDGAGVEAVKIYAVANMSGDGAFVFDQTNDGYSNVGCTAKNFTLFMDGYEGHGIVWRKPYDGFDPTNISVYGVHEDYHAIVVESDPDVTDVVSQTMTMTNVIGAHEVNTTSTTSVFYFKNLQEAVLINCKGFGSVQPVDQTETRGDCHTFEFEDCRGVQIIGCSSAFSKKHGILVTAVNRPSTGINIVGHTYETIDGMLKAVGSTVNGFVSQIAHIQPRFEGDVSHADGAIILEAVINASIDARDQTVDVDSDCDVITINTTDATVVSIASGVNYTIHAAASGANGGAYLAATTASIRNKSGADEVKVTTSQITMTNDGAAVGRFQYPYGTGGTSLWLLYNDGATPEILQVVVDENGFLKVS